MFSVAYLLSRLLDRLRLLGYWLGVLSCPACRQGELNLLDDDRVWVCIKCKTIFVRDRS